MFLLTWATHRGFPVLGTTPDYFNYYKYGNKVPAFKEGRIFSRPFELVLGYDVAKTFGYTLDKQLYLSHGIAKGPLRTHKNL